MHIVSAEAVARRVAATSATMPRVVASGNFATPRTLLGIVDAVLPSYRLFVLNAQLGIPTREGVVHETPFVGAGMRRTPGLAYLPSRLSLVPHLMRTTAAPDIVCVNTTVPVDGTVSLGTEVNVLPAAIDACHDRGGLVVAQLNPSMPYTYGDAQLSVDDIDLAFEAGEPLAEPALRVPDAASCEIAEQVAALVADRSTLQMGIGMIPDAVLDALRGRRGLRVWTEMFSDGVLGLDRAGALDPDAVLTTSFVFGTQELYAWVHRNPRVALTRTEKSNDPAWIARQPRMTSVNSALEVDLYGQANASYVRGRIYSGFGGQTDFIVGALHAHDGNAVMALRSWHPAAEVSTIVPQLSAPATSFQQSYVVTEQGTARLWGLTQHEQAAQLISVAHPRARDGLRAAAGALGLA